MIDCFKEKLLKMKHLNQCIVAITRNCNLRCSFCYAKETGYAESESIGYNEITEIVDFCDEAKVKYVVFTGGEPTLHPDIIDIVEYIKDKNYEIIPTMTTNGISLANEEFCKKLVEGGLKYIDISLKGSNSKNCYETVGVDCIDKQMKAINNLSQLSVELTCSMVLTHNNIFTFCDVVEKAYENGARQFSFTFVLDNEESKYENAEYLKHNNPFELIDLFVVQIDKLNAITNGEWWVEYTFPLCFYTEEQLYKLKGRLAAPCHIFFNNSITIDVNKNVIPCTMHIGKNMGRFGEDFVNAKEFIERVEEDPYKRIIDDLTAMPSEDCSICEFFEQCHGGCPIIWKNFTYDAAIEFKKAYRNA